MRMLMDFFSFRLVCMQNLFKKPQGVESKGVAINKSVVSLLLSLLIGFSLLDVSASELPQLSVEGINKHTATSGLGLFITRSEVATQGAESKLILWNKYACEDARIRLAMDEAIKDSPKIICKIAASALDFVRSQSWVENISITLLIVPSRVNYHKKFFRIGRGPKLVLIAPVLQTEEATLANIADLVAHEAFHVGMFAAGDTALAGNEYAAYHYGLCGQLVALGRLEPSALPGFGVASNDPHVVESSESAERVRAEVIQAFDGHPMTKESDAGEALIAQCRAFKPAGHRD
ncbi:hypothetical protein NG829_18895 [Xanthomonas sacchari]|uniref:hypothetical protein n=1 Tax=Xanthomonas TaxID=338 RepID=UPI0012E0B850|nr:MULTISPECIES: hypothetical protein [Xanthomonas]MDY4341031.1 hypothetical protein [Xanthomonas sp. LF07-6]UYK80380.1 hypothetical protein NG829_18895 [Xanthomonas sacchari]